MNGRTKPSSYAGGNYVYWLGLMDNDAYSLIMVIEEKPDKNQPKIKQDHLSTSGTTYGIDFMIGNKEYFGKG